MEKSNGQLGQQIILASNKEAIIGAWKSFKPMFAMFISSVESASSFHDEFIADTIDGYRLELLKTGQSDVAMGDNVLQESPYTTRLRPVTDISTFNSQKDVFLTKAVYRAIDVTLTGNTDQDTQIIADIESSLSLSNDSYVQSRFRFAEIGNWQPNFFRPHLQTKSVSNVFSTFGSSNFGEKRNKGDLSIGPMLPYEYEPPMPIWIGPLLAEPDCLQVYCGAGQIVEDTVTHELKIQRYPVVAYFEFLGVK